MIYIITTFIVAIVMCLICYKPVCRLLAEKRAIPILEKALFYDDAKHKACVMKRLHLITNKRLKDEIALDYFFKIKGLQVLNINKPMNFWVKTYLKSPTKVKLNYFEQVKFYETFLNFPKINEGDKKTQIIDAESKQNTVKACIKKKMNNDLISQRPA